MRYWPLSVSSFTKIGLPVFIFIFGLTSTLAQNDCPIIPSEDLLARTDVCANQGLNTLCVGKEPSAVGFARGTADFTAGDTLPLDSLMQVNTQHSNSTETGLAFITTDAGVVTNPIRLILYGGASLETGIGVTTLDLPLITISNTEDYALNLREGPGTSFGTVGLFPAGTQLWADGRSPDDQWLRVRTDSGTAWVNIMLVQVMGDLNTLLPLDTLYTAPMQIMRLRSSDCGGLLIQRQGTERVHLQINGADLALTSTILIAQSTADGLRLHVLDGDVRVVAAGQSVDATGGQSVSLALDEDLNPTGTPVVQEKYPFAAIDRAPLVLVSSDSLTCVAGLTTSESLTPFSGPGDSYTALRALDNQTHYAVTGAFTDASAQAWWRLENNQWIPQNRILTAGQCDVVAEVAPPSADTLTVLPTSPLAPDKKIIYQAESGPDVMTGDCTGSPLAICSHPAAMWPNGDGSLSWRGQEPIDYRLVPTGENLFTYSGRNFSQNANLTLNMTLTSPTTWSMTMTTIYDNDPKCNHVFYYTGTAR